MEIITLEEFQAYTGIHDNDDLSTQLIDSAEAIVINYLGYSPVQATYTDTISGNGKNEISLYRKNVSNITSLTIDGVAIDPTKISTCGANGECIFFDGGIFPAGHGNIIISYTAGWETIPAEIKMAVLRIAALLQSESGGNIGITSKSFGDSGNRTYVKTIDYTPYLLPVAGYKVIGL
jgi:hypothetical protein